MCDKSKTIQEVDEFIDELKEIESKDSSYINREYLRVKRLSLYIVLNDIKDECEFNIKHNKEKEKYTIILKRINKMKKKDKFYKNTIYQRREDLYSSNERLKSLYSAIDYIEDKAEQAIKEADNHKNLEEVNNLIYNIYMRNFDNKELLIDLNSHIKNYNDIELKEFLHRLNFILTELVYCKHRHDKNYKPNN